MWEIPVLTLRMWKWKEDRLLHNAMGWKIPACRKTGTLKYWTLRMLTTWLACFQNYWQQQRLKLRWYIFSRKLFVHYKYPRYFSNAKWHTSMWTFSLNLFTSIKSYELYKWLPVFRFHFICIKPPNQISSKQISQMKTSGKHYIIAFIYITSCLQ